jgi:Xaa-Pro aminopeptidase
VVHRAQAAALALARPGLECGTVDVAARKVITATGYGPGYKYFSHRLGHGIGMDMHEWPYLVVDWCSESAVNNRREMHRKLDHSRIHELALLISQLRH